jgi:hypothetical protein
MNTFHTIWTKPAVQRNIGFEMNNAEILTMVISALMWRKYNGKIKLYTDEVGYDFLKSKGLTDAWDEIDCESLENNNYPIDPIIFWAAGKLIALEACPCPCVMLDTDLIVMHSISDDLAASDIIALHPEELNPVVYIEPKHLKLPCNYVFPNYYCWDVLPFNTALLYVNNNKFKDFYLQHSKKFMFQNYDKPMEYVSQMVFAEQRLLSICANYKNTRVKTILDSPFETDNKTIIHLWGYKSTLRSNKYLNAIFIEKLIHRFQNELADYPLFNLLTDKRENCLTKMLI